jgi:hypothetical protein
MPPVNGTTKLEECDTLTLRQPAHIHSQLALPSSRYSPYIT